MIARVRVLESWAETPTVHAVRFEKPAGFDFRPVQFCGLELATAEGPIEYPMSLASSPTRPHLEFGARVVSGSPFKRALAALAPGDDAEVDGPYGHFVLDEARPAVFAAGGIGITPLKGMAEYAADTRLAQDLVLLYSNRDATDIPYRAALSALERANPRFHVVHTLTKPKPEDAWTGRTGRIGEALLREATDGLRDPAYYVCGRDAMVEGTARTLLRLGVPRERIHYEVFRGYES